MIELFICQSVSQSVVLVVSLLVALIAILKPGIRAKAFIIVIISSFRSGLESDAMQCCLSAIKLQCVTNVSINI